MKNKAVRFTFPVDGELITRSNAVSCAPRALAIQAKGIAAPRAAVTVNGATTRAGDDGVFSVKLTLDQRFPGLVASAGAHEDNIRVACDFNGAKRYNFFIDDNIFFLTEIVRRQHKSLFDSFYLAFLRAMHERYGLCVTLNIFFRNDHAPFDLTEMPDTYKPEWEDNASWLRLAFHAYSEFPDNPYGKAFPEKLPEHYQRVAEQICRFAGEATLVAPVIMHFYDIADEASRRFIRARGLRLYTRPESFWQALCTKHGREFRGFYDHDFDQLLIPLEFVCNSFPTEVLLQKLEAAYARGSDFINLGSHEQYSYPFYSRYIPDHFARIEACLKSLADHGYRPAYLGEELLAD